MRNNTIKTFDEFTDLAITLIDECPYQNGYITCDKDGVCNYRYTPKLIDRLFECSSYSHMLSYDTNSFGAFSASVKYLKQLRETREENTMNMSTIKNGQIVELRNGEKLYKCGNILVNNEIHMPIDFYDCDLKCKEIKDHSFSADDDIVKVYKLADSTGYRTSHIDDVGYNTEDIQWERKEDEPETELVLKLGDNVKLVTTKDALEKYVRENREQEK